MFTQFRQENALKPSVAVIGTGPSGLTVTKSLVEHGLEPVVYDSAPAIGGMWGAPGRGAWTSGARTNLSCYCCAFSDFPWPQGTDIFPMRSSVIGYLNDYAQAFALHRYLRMCTTVELVEPAGEHRWNVTTCCDGVRETRCFDHVVVATGVFSQPFVPEFEGLEAFRGEVFHAADCYGEDVIRKNFSGKRLFIMGAAFSGTEIAGQLLGVAQSVTVGLRHPMWFLPRWIQPWSGAPRYPSDLVFYNRDPENPMVASPRAYLLQVGADPGKISPELAFDDIATAPLTVVTSDDFLQHVGAGRVRVKRSKAFAFDEKGVLYADGSREDIDAVVMCTGYVSRLPFLRQDVLDTLAFDVFDQLQPVLLHKQVFHPRLPGLAFVGYYRGPYFPIMELHGRWVARVAAGELPLPSVDEMNVGVEAERRIRNRRPRPQFPHGDFVRLADGLAREVGAFPDCDVAESLIDRIKFGPVVSSQFRLCGPHAKPELATRILLATPAPLLDGKK